MKLLIISGLLVLLGAGCSDYLMTPENADQIRKCTDAGGKAYAYFNEQINCEFRP